MTTVSNKKKKIVKKLAKKRCTKSNSSRQCIKDLKCLRKTNSLAKRSAFLAKCKHKKGLVNACQRGCKALLKNPSRFYKTNASFMHDKAALTGGARSKATAARIVLSGKGILDKIVQGFISLFTP